METKLEPNKPDIHELLAQPVIRKYRPSYTFPKLISETREYLSDHFDLDKITTIEGVELRQCCEKAARLYCSQIERYDVDDLSCIHVIWPVKEAAYLWLCETLGITINDIFNNLSRTKRWHGSEDFNNWIAIERNRRNQVDWVE
jgi:hypothetical protein